MRLLQVYVLKKERGNRYIPSSAFQMHRLEHYMNEYQGSTRKRNLLHQKFGMHAQYPICFHNPKLYNSEQQQTCMEDWHDLNSQVDNIPGEKFSILQHQQQPPLWPENCSKKIANGELNATSANLNNLYFIFKRIGKKRRKKRKTCFCLHTIVDTRTQISVFQ